MLKFLKSQKDSFGDMEPVSLH